MSHSSAKTFCKSANQTGGLTPVSYTHLDVYKRQSLTGAKVDAGLDGVKLSLLDAMGMDILSGLMGVVLAVVGASVCGGGGVALVGAGPVGMIAVSYTHLDVYKRQDNDLAVVNGHSYKDLKSDNTNVSVLCSHNFSIPFNQPIAYAQKVGELTNMLGNGHILVQRFGDILDGKRTWQKELAQSNVRPTLPDAVAGDITAAMPYRAMTNIINFIQAADVVVPGFASSETLLYSPELKFYSNRVKMDEQLNTNVRGLHCLGDSSGWTRGLMMASAMGVLMGRKLAENEA